MGNQTTRKDKINKIRNIMEKAKGKGIAKKKLIALMMMDGNSARNINEIIQSFIDFGEIKEKEEEGEVLLLYE